MCKSCLVNPECLIKLSKLNELPGIFALAEFEHLRDRTDDKQSEVMISIFSHWDDVD